MSKAPTLLGEYIKYLVEEQNITLTELGKKINKTSQNVLDIYKRTAIDSDLLISISKVLNKNVFEYFDQIEPIQTFRQQEIAQWESRIAALEQQINTQQETIRLLENHLETKDQLIRQQEETLALLRKAGKK